VTVRSTSTCRTNRSASSYDVAIETRRLQLLVALARLGSMRAVADELGYTTSTVSQQLGVLAGEVGATLLEREGRRVRLTPAGRRLAEHAVTILAGVEAARADLDPAAEPAGTVRVAGFATAIRRTLVPAVGRLSAEHPSVHLRVLEHEPAEAFALLEADEVDLALVYDYDLAPRTFAAGLCVTPMWTAEWGLAVPAAAVPAGAPLPEAASAVSAEAPPAEAAAPSPAEPDAAAVFRRFADSPWIVNSRNTADEEVVRVLASLAGFEPAIAHRVDSLELVRDLILAGLGVGLVPADEPPAPGVRLLCLRRPAVTLRAYAVTRRGRERWPPLALVGDLLRTDEVRA
jgi:DNA-binding transcriptional LysR family regulator